MQGPSTQPHRSDLEPLLHPDPLIRQVLETWTPRFMAAGVPIGELARTVERVGTWDDWPAEWYRTATYHEERGDRLAADDRRAAATAAWLLAANCYHIGYHVAVRDHDLHDDGLTSMLAVFEKARPHLRPQVDRIEIGQGESRIVGLLSTPDSTTSASTTSDDPATTEPVPVVILLPGLDSTKETRHGAAGRWTARGVAALSVDGPGQGEASRWSTIRPDYEHAVSAVIDWIETQPGLDSQRVAVVGMSLGGYYAPRAAAFEPRLAAAVGNCGPYRWIDCWDLIPAVTREAFIYYSGAATEAEARAIAADLTLEGVASQIQAPLLIVHGERDPLIPWQHGQQIVDEAGGEAELVLVEGGNHGVNNLPFESGPVILDWVCDRLGIDRQ